jgi:transcriptional regulator with XRE-family HTH domain
MVKSLYKKIKLLREENNFSQEYIARELGMSRPTYMQIEKGERELTISESEKIAAIFGMQLKGLLFPEGVSDKKIIFVEEKSKKKSKTDGVRIIVNRADIIKFKEVLLYILEKVGAKQNIGETALYKLLYFIDFDFYEKFEEQLTGARYIKNHYGPTPMEFKKVVEEMVERGEIEKVNSKYFKYDQKKYLPHRNPDLRILSALEIKHIDEVLSRLSDKNAGELTEYSHSDVPWRVHEYGEIISYESVFYRDPDHSVREYEDEL